MSLGFSSMPQWWTTACHVEGGSAAICHAPGGGKFYRGYVMLGDGSEVGW